MPGPSETPAHLALKRATQHWARAQGYDAVATEVRIPRSSYRADVVACDTTLKGGARVVRTAVFECKQARADLLKDSREVNKTLQRIEALSARKHELDRLLGTHFPSLRTGDELFSEFVVPVDAASLGHEGYAKVCAELDTLLRRLYGKTKFDKLLRYQNADLHYLVVMDGILQPHEAPQGWGILAWDGHSFAADTDGVPELSLRAKPQQCRATEACRLEMLIGIAKAATRLTRQRDNLLHVAEAINPLPE